MDAPVTTDMLRHSLELIEPLLTGFAPPAADSFNPAGSWTQTYRILPFRLQPKALSGQLKIQRVAQSDGARIAVEQELRMMKEYSQWTKASLQCAADRWSTPRSFAAESWTVAPDGKAESDSREKFSAEVVGQEIRFSGMPKPPVRVGHDWTLDWTLLDALQRLHTEHNAAWNFDLVEDCDLLRPRQRLSYVGPLAAKVAGKPLELYGFLHLGTGTLPTHYWLDQQHRLLFVVRYYRAFILTSSTAG